MEKSLLVCFVLTLGIFHYSNAACPDGWLHHGSSCYFFSTDEYDWQTAQDICREYKGGYLAEIETKEESDYLEGFTRPKQLSYWLGGKDDITEGKWYWENSKRPFNYTDWNPGEPNDQGNNEDCLHLFPTHNQHWNDFLCSNKQNYICEASFISTGP